MLRATTPAATPQCPRHPSPGPLRGKPRMKSAVSQQKKYRFSCAIHSTQTHLSWRLSCLGGQNNSRVVQTVQGIQIMGIPLCTPLTCLDGVLLFSELPYFQAPPGTQTDLELESMRGDGTKLTIRSLLHYLYNEAGLTRWTPPKLGKRSWSIARRELLTAALPKKTKNRNLPALLYFHESFNLARAEDIKGR